MVPKKPTKKHTFHWFRVNFTFVVPSDSCCFRQHCYFFCYFCQIMQIALESMIELEKVGNVGMVSVLPPQHQSSVKSRYVQEAEGLETYSSLSVNAIISLSSAWS